jgi:hypothetical protein
MAKEKSARGASVPAEPEYTTFRIYAGDGEDLSDLARLCGLTIAELYREVCAPLIRARRVKELEDQLKKLKHS